jgi:hypothetical protein
MNIIYYQLLSELNIDLGRITILPCYERSNLCYLVKNRCTGGYHMAKLVTYINFLYGYYKIDMYEYYYIYRPFSKLESFKVYYIDEMMDINYIKFYIVKNALQDQTSVFNIMNLDVIYYTFNILTNIQFI